jgi:hypothetical protein
MHQNLLGFGTVRRWCLLGNGSHVGVKALLHAWLSRATRTGNGPG